MNYTARRACKIGDVRFSIGAKWTGTPQKCSNCDGAGCSKCGQTGRSIPPYHFEEDKTDIKPTSLGQDSIDVQDVTNSQIASIRGQFDKNGWQYDRRWGLSTMQAKYDEFKKEFGEPEAAISE